jgi:hypothetical protein
MPNPIQNPTYRYPALSLPQLDHLPVAPGAVVRDPRLRILQIPWKPPANLTKKQQIITGDDYLQGNRVTGKFTVFVFCFGDYESTHRRCLDSIFATIPRDKVQVRIAAVAVGPASQSYLQSLPAQKVYWYERPTPKYRVMRDLFWDEHNPIDSKYVIWFDDNAYVANGNWLSMLIDDVNLQTDQVGMYGLRLYYRLRLGDTDPRVWFYQQPWHNGQPFRTHKGSPAPNGDTIHFGADWFWVLSTQAMQDCNIPTLGMPHVGGDIIMGEQLYQHGYSIKPFNLGHSMVKPTKLALRDRMACDTRFPWS